MSKYRIRYFVRSHSTDNHAQFARKWQYVFLLIVTIHQLLILTYFNQLLIFLFNAALYAGIRRRLRTLQVNKRTDGLDVTQAYHPRVIPDGGQQRVFHDDTGNREPSVSARRTTVVLASRADEEVAKENRLFSNRI